MTKTHPHPLPRCVSAVHEFSHRKFATFYAISGYTLCLPHTLLVDGTRIMRVLTNIIDNAIDAMTAPHTSEAAGHLRFNTYETERRGKHYGVIVIADDGPGIPPGVIARIFDPFFSQGKKGGTGLGLAICQQIITLHGGTILARNMDGGRGAQFTIELPCGNENADVDENELIKHSAELEPFRREEAARVDYGDTANTSEFLRINKERGRPSYLLIVDDEPLFREGVRVLLHELPEAVTHVKVIEADSAEMGLKILEEHEFDYVIADIDLGARNMNGYDFAQIVLGRYPGAHVLIHSNKRREEMDRTIRTVSRNNFMGFLPKPMQASELLQFLACKTFEAATNKSVPQECKAILLVNDDDALRICLKFQLKAVAGDVRIIEADSMAEALTVLSTTGIDIVLSDINMGTGKPDGYELLKTVRMKGISPKVYMVSGKAQAEEAPKAISLGADGYLQLPIDEYQLRIVLENLRTQ